LIEHLLPLLAHWFVVRTLKRRTLAALIKYLTNGGYLCLLTRTTTTRRQDRISEWLQRARVAAQHTICCWRYVKASFRYTKARSTN